MTNEHYSNWKAEMDKKGVRINEILYQCSSCNEEYIGHKDFDLESVVGCPSCNLNLLHPGMRTIGGVYPPQKDLPDDGFF